MKSNLESYLDKLTAIFARNDYREAHQKGKPVLLEMAQDKTVLFGIMKQEMSKPGFFSSKRINPVIAFNFFRNKDFSINAHCWMPLPDRRTDVSHQSVHHHGKLLLTSASPFGSGYESVLFKKGYQLNKEQGVAKMKVEKIYPNPQHNVEFVDTDTPHIVFYPPELSITYAMWSYDKKNGFVSSLRQAKFLQANKKLFLRLLRKIGLVKYAGINVLEYFDFYPDGEELVAMQDRVMYPVGTNENFVHNLFYILQKTGFDEYDFIRGLYQKLTPQEQKIAEIPMNKFLAGEPIEDIFDPVHLNIPKINFRKDELLKVVQQ